MYLKSPLRKVGMIEMFVDVKKIVLYFQNQSNLFFFSNFEYAQSNFIFEMGICFHKFSQGSN
jgi:hypothetical protein